MCTNFDDFLNSATVFLRSKLKESEFKIGQRRLEIN